jgi:hypothetical protein
MLGPNTCRTCGYTDCPGAQTGNCPRWPAREGMFAELTRAELLTLHNRLHNSHQRLHRQIVSASGIALVSPLGDVWRIIDAACVDIAETAAAVFAEIGRRESVPAQREPIDA